MPANRILLGVLLATALYRSASGDQLDLPRQQVILVVGAAGSEEYERTFSEWADKWRAAAELAEARVTQIGTTEPAATDRELLRATLRRRHDAEGDLLWLVLLGHGTYDGQTAKFNLRGPDVTAAELAEWLQPLEISTVVVNCASSSGPFINRLASEDRVVITAAKSGYELNFARFGGFLADAIVDPAADLDKDDQVSLLEAYLTACRRVEEFYQRDARLATEHALVDDNADGLGTPASWFRGLRATQRAKSGAELDGPRAHQIHLVPSDREARMPRELREQRDAIEFQLAELREQKSSLAETDYYSRLEELMLELARIYHRNQTVGDPEP